MDTRRFVCKYCGNKNNSPKGDDSLLSFNNDVCPNCMCIKKIETFVADYDENHKDSIVANEFYDKNMIKNNNGNFVSYSLANHTSEYVVMNRTKRVSNIIDRINYIRDYLYLTLEPIFKILDSIYINQDIFWEDTGNLLKYVHNCCLQEAVIKLTELLTNAKCKYSIPKIKNILIEDSKHIFSRQEIYELMTFHNSKDQIKEKYPPFDIKGLMNLIDSAYEDVSYILNSMKDFRDNRFAHVDLLKDKDSTKNLTNLNIKRIYSLTKSVYNAFLYAVAPDKYTTLRVDANIWFSHLNDMSVIYKDHLRQQDNEIAKHLSNG